MRNNSVEKINDAVAQYFTKNQNIERAKPKDLMPLLITSGLFEKDQSEGLPLRKILRELDGKNQLDLVPSLLADRKKVNVSWFFLRPGKAKPTNMPKKVIIKKEVVVTTKKRKDSDEAYVIDLCDEVLGASASRQHKFDFLKGDAGTRLPVDSYYSSLKLVIEYREKQHTEEVKHFDKPDVMTVSGVNRGDQRKIYDQRRRDVLPENGIKLIEISYSDFNYDSKKKIIREKKRDTKIIKDVLTESNIIK